MQTMELIIDNKAYQFKAGIKFMQKANKPQFIVNDGIRVDVGLSLMLGNIMECDVLALRDALLLMNEGCTPRVTEKILDDYIENDTTDIDDLFVQVLDFFKNANCTKKTVQRLEKEKEKQSKKM